MGLCVMTLDLFRLSAPYEDHAGGQYMTRPQSDLYTSVGGLELRRPLVPPLSLARGLEEGLMGQ